MIWRLGKCKSKKAGNDSKAVVWGLFDEGMGSILTRKLNSPTISPSPLYTIQFQEFISKPKSDGFDLFKFKPNQGHSNHLQSLKIDP